MTEKTAGQYQGVTCQQNASQMQTATGAGATYCRSGTMAVAARLGTMWFRKAKAALAQFFVAVPAMGSKATCCPVSGPAFASTTHNGGCYTAPSENSWRSPQ